MKANVARHRGVGPFAVSMPMSRVPAESAEQFVSFVDAILFHASKAPSNPAIGLENGVLTYGQLAGAIFAATVRCENAGLRPGSLIGLIIADPVWHICLIAALYRLGVASVSISAEEAAIFSDGDLAAVLHDGVKPQDYKGGAILVEPDWFTQRAAAVRNVESAFRVRDLCRVALSSGTTGQPKPIALSPDIIWQRLVTYSFRGGFAASERIFCGPQLRSQFGFAIAFSALIYGKMICFSGTAETSIPVMSYYKVDLAILSVFQLSSVVDVLTKNYGALGGLREIQAGGALISDVLLQRVRACISSEIVSTYASTEAGTVAFAPVEQLGAARGEGAVGFVVPWASVEVYDDENRRMPVGRDGNIRINTLGIAPVYEPGMREVAPPEPFFPGDFGRLLSNGMLVVGGRSTELINIGGNKVSPDRFENILMQCQGVKDAAVFTVDINSVLPQVWAAIVAEPTINMAEIMKRCFETPMIGTPTVIRAVTSIPRNSAGKILRDQLRKELTKGSA
jgi:acyl-coenzyme A synthetase/AMP-(fatty) acid ligase